MLKKVILGIIVGAIVLTTSAGFLYAYQKESGSRQNLKQQSNIASKNDPACTNENCLNDGTDQNCTNNGDCTDCQNNQNGQGLKNSQENNENCSGGCLNSDGSSNKNGNGSSYKYKNQNQNCNEINLQNMSRNRFKNNQ